MMTRNITIAEHTTVHRGVHAQLAFPVEKGDRLKRIVMSSVDSHGTPHHVGKTFDPINVFFAKRRAIEGVRITCGSPQEINASLFNTAYVVTEPGELIFLLHDRGEARSTAKKTRIVEIKLTLERQVHADEKH